MILLLLAIVVSGALALTDTERAAVVDIHNTYRQRVASGNEPNKDGTKLPTATDMNQIVYDTGIESIAQAWAAGCKFAHSSSQQRNNTGENLYMSSGKQTPTVALKAASDLWWKELKDYGVSTSLLLTMEEFNKGIGHWTQMAWAKTNRIGCGVQACPSGTIVVCNYAPAGNYLNQNIYTAGTTCSKCASGTSCSNSLCAVGGSNPAPPSQPATTRASLPPPPAPTSAPPPPPAPTSQAPCNCAQLQNRITELEQRVQQLEGQ